MILGATCCIAHKSTKSISATKIDDIRVAIKDIDDNIKQVDQNKA